MRALVTGGAGYIGSVVAAALLDAGHQVDVVDNLSDGHRDAVPGGAAFHELSVGDTDALREVLGSGAFDVCYHFAGSIALGLSMSAPEAFFANNVGESLLLLDVLVECGVPRFVFSSSAAVYGEPQYTPIDESHPTIPVSPYGESKLMVEHALGWLARRGRIRFATLRYFNASGAAGNHAERHVPETHLIPLALAVAAGERDDLTLHGDDYPTPDGTCVRDYIHVSDLASAHMRAMELLDRHETIVCNLGSGTGTSNAAVIQAVRDVTGHPVPVRLAPRRAGDPSTLVAAIDHARTLLGWEPSSSTITQIVSDAWDARRAPVAS
jgi:UDP-glucose 4-epimerase